MTRNVLFIFIFLMALHVANVGYGATSSDLVENIAEDEENSPVGLKGIDLEEEESGKVAKTKRRFILPPFLYLEKERQTFRTFFPFYFQSERYGKGARRDLGILPFYWSHDSKEYRTRVYFPFYWDLKSPKFKTDIVLQTYYARNDDGFNFGSAPFFFVGKNRKNASSYQIILPPLFFNFKKGNSGFTYSLLYFNKWNANEFSRLLFPLYFSRKKNEKTLTTVLPPVFWHVNDPINYRTTTVLPPFFLTTRENGWSAGLLPFLYFARDKNWSRNMVMPFYYGSRVNDLKSHYLPLVLTYWRSSKELKQGGVALFYHWYRYRGEYLNMYSPLLWRWGNERKLEKSIFLAPLFYSKTSPVENNTMAGMIYWNYHNYHISRTFAIAPLFAIRKSLDKDAFRTWVFPTFDFGKNPDGYHARIHPIFYVGKNKNDKHLVLAPLLWRFSNEKSTNTVIFPLWWQFDNTYQKRKTRVAFPLWWQFDDYKYKEYSRVLFPFYWDFKKVTPGTRTIVTLPPLFWRVSDKNSVRSGVLNVSVHKGKRKGNDFWTFNLFPLLLFGKPPSPEGARWELLHGLVGWRRQGHAKELKLFWIPFSVGD